MIRVRDHEVGPVESHEPERLLAVGSLAHDYHGGALPRNKVAHDGAVVFGVVGHNDGQGHRPGSLASKLALGVCTMCARPSNEKARA